MSAATPSTASSTSCTSPSPTLPAEASAVEPRLQAAAQAHAAAQEGSGKSGDASGQAAWSAGAHPDEDPRPAAPDRPRSRIAWCITGSGHYLEESLAVAGRLPDVDLFLSAAGEEVLPFYGRKLDELKQRFRVYRDRSASAVPVGMLYEDVYHTVVIAPATSNTVAKCAYGISDTLPTNLFAQAGKLGVLGIVFACDTEPVVVTTAPRTSDQEWFTLRPRRIELENVERLRAIDHCQVVTTPAELEAALAARLAALTSLASS